VQDPTPIEITGQCKLLGKIWGKTKLMFYIYIFCPPVQKRSSATGLVRIEARVSRNTFKNVFGQTYIRATGKHRLLVDPFRRISN